MISIYILLIIEFVKKFKFFLTISLHIFKHPGMKLTGFGDLGSVTSTVLYSFLKFKRKMSKLFHQNRFRWIIPQPHNMIFVLFLQNYSPIHH